MLMVSPINSLYACMIVVLFLAVIRIDKYVNVVDIIDILGNVI